MQLRRIDRFLIITASISFILFCVSFTAGRRTSPRPVQSALLNPSVREKISLVLIQEKDKQLVLKSSEGRWFCESDGITTSANPELVNIFLDRLSKIRKMYKISDRKEAMAELGLAGDDSKTVVLVDSAQKTAARLSFGQEDSLTSRIAVATLGGKVSYETENDVSPYLYADINFWTEPEIFFAIKNPSNLSLSESDLHTLLSLRHGKILSRAELPLNAEKTRSAVLIGQYNFSQRVNFYRCLNNGTEEYFYTQDFYPNTLDANALYEISGWTYQRLIGLLDKK